MTGDEKVCNRLESTRLSACVSRRPGRVSTPREVPVQPRFPHTKSSIFGSEKKHKELRAAALSINQATAGCTEGQRVHLTRLVWTSANHSRVRKEDASCIV